MSTISPDTAEELRLLSTILDRLLSSSTTGTVRIDQLQSLACRLRSAVGSIDTSAIPPLSPAGHVSADGQPLPGSLAAKQAPGLLGASFSGSKPPPASVSAGTTGAAAAAPLPAAEEKRRGRKGKNTVMAAPDKSTVLARQALRQSSTRIVPIPRETPPVNKLLVSKEVARVFTCTLYNVLEAITNMLEATTASIFVKVGDEMASIVNVAPRLSFPPKLNHHRCQDSYDAEVLGSGIAVNQRIHAAGAGSSSALIFPVHAGGNIRAGRQSAIATVHVENKVHGKKHFDEFDETLLFFGAELIGEVMSRVPMDWTENFFDPATQHIVAPFTPVRLTSLPLLETPLAAATHLVTETDAGKRARLVSRIDSFAEDVLIKRESLPPKLNKPTIGGLSVMPSLREVSNYVENMQDCWRRNASSNVGLMEESREGQMELRMVRRELSRTQQRLAECEEQLRLYQLQGGDYKQEYRELRNELDAYIHKRDRVIM